MVYHLTRFGSVSFKMGGHFSGNNMLRIGNHLHRDIRNDPEALIVKLTTGIAGAYAVKVLDELLAAAPTLIAADGHYLMHF